jgi:L-2-hydroxyglutarate oxidase LhgO
MHDIDCLVVGAGVIGLAVARAFAISGREVLILEREWQLGTQTSSRNSEVIHAGIYYEPGSLKAQSCVAGRERLYRYCVRHGIAHQRCGKFVVATDVDQTKVLEKIEAVARKCDVGDLEWLEPSQARRAEPQLACTAVLHSPSTGIIDSHEYMLSLLGEAEAHGADIVYGTRVSTVEPTRRGLCVTVDGAAEPALRCHTVVNAAGLDAARIARCVRNFPSEHIPPIFYAKGSYFALSGRVPFRRLIYPVPEAGGLGVHMTVDLGGQARFGPDVEWVGDIDYEVDEKRVDGFYAAIRRYWPGLRDGQLHAAYAGIRPKLSGPGQPAADFLISGPSAHGVPGIVNLFGIESPGLTASLDLADRVIRAADDGR